jgi:DNA-binding transcriptional ArsR family regulator
MVNYSLDKVFSALSDPTRRAILERLAEGEASVGELAAPFLKNEDMTLPAISKHLHVLENAGMITRAKEGRTHYIRLTATSMKDAAEWLAYYRHFWDEQFNALDQYLKNQEKEDKS